ncbi:MAG: hypothetical protein IT304_04140 [Dehalococcoidia bacterium]|nr:hypothetical protein [Dehalococcoidia bacterium]
MAATYPADDARAAVRFFLSWFGPHFARSATPDEFAEAEAGVLTGTITVGRRWQLRTVLANTIAGEAMLDFEAERAALEERLDAAGHSLAVWVPRGAPLPASDADRDAFLAALDGAVTVEDGRRELRRRVPLYLRRTDIAGSIVTITGGLSAHWAQFTNRVPGSFWLNSQALNRLPADQAERDALAERIVLAAGQPLADETQVVEAEDAWTISPLDEGGSCVFGSPRAESDEQSAALRRSLRKLLRAANPILREPADARALLILAATTYASEEKVSWTLRGMDPALYGGYDLIAVLADGVAKVLLQPGRAALPWDAPPPE